MIKRSETDSILAEQLGLRKEIPRHMFQQLIAKASDDVRRKLEAGTARFGEPDSDLGDRCRREAAIQVRAGTEELFTAKRVVAAQHQYGNLNESSILEYARSHKIEEAMAGLSLLLRVEATMSLLFLGAKDHRISASDLNDMREEFISLNTETSRSVLRFYQSRKNAAAAESDPLRLPQLHALG